MKQTYSMEDIVKNNNEEDDISLRAKREARLTEGLGYGNKKRNALEAFWDVVWPGLEAIGWKRVSILSLFGSDDCLFDADEVLHRSIYSGFHV